MGRRGRIFWLHRGGGGGGVISPVASLRTTTIAQSIYTDPFTPTVGFTVSFRSDFQADNNRYFFSNDNQASPGGIQFYQVDQNTYRFQIKDGATKSVDVDAYGYGDKVTLELQADGWHFYKNDIQVAEILTGTWSGIANQLVFGNNRMTTTVNSSPNARFWDIEINSETWDLSEGSGTTATGSLGTVLTLQPNAAGGGVLADMWTTSLRYNTDNANLFRFNKNNNFESISDSYELGTYTQKRIVASKDVTYFQPNQANPTNYYVNDTPIFTDVNDNMSPIYIYDSIVGGNHSWGASSFTVSGKTVAGDIYSLWQHSTSGNQIILLNVNGSTCIFTTRTTAQPPIETGTYNHVSGATNTSSFTLSGSGTSINAYPSTNVITKKFYVDGIEVSASAFSVNDCETAMIEEVYNIPDEQAWKDYFITLQGTGVVAQNNAGTPIAQITNTYTFDGSPFITGRCKFEALANITSFQNINFIQQNGFSEVGDFWYVPKTSSFTNADGTFNFSNLTPYQDLTVDATFDSSNAEFPTSPADRQLEILTDRNAVFAYGFLPVLDAAIGTRINNTTQSCNINAVEEKLYMRAVSANEVGTSLTLGDSFEVRYYRGVIPKSTERTASYFVTDHATGKGYMYADWHDLPKVDSIPVPTKYQGRTYTVLEKTSNVTLAAGTLGSTLSVSIAATHNYGFVTIEIGV